MHAIDRSSLLFTAGVITTKPIRSAIGAGVSELEATLLYALQIITSLAALPIIASMGLCEAAYRIITDEGMTALSSIQSTLILLTNHIIWLIPGVTLAIFISKETAETVHDSLSRCANRVTNIWLCLDCSEEIAPALEEEPRHVSPPTTPSFKSVSGKASHVDEEEKKEASEPSLLSAIAHHSDDEHCETPLLAPSPSRLSRSLIKRSLKLMSNRSSLNISEEEKSASPIFQLAASIALDADEESTPQASPLSRPLDRNSPLQEEEKSNSPHPSFASRIALDPVNQSTVMSPQTPIASSSTTSSSPVYAINKTSAENGVKIDDAPRLPFAPIISSILDEESLAMATQAAPTPRNTSSSSAALASDKGSLENEEKMQAAPSASLAPQSPSSLDCESIALPPQAASLQTSANSAFPLPVNERSSLEMEEEIAEAPRLPLAPPIPSALNDESEARRPQSASIRRNAASRSPVSENDEFSPNNEEGANSAPKPQRATTIAASFSEKTAPIPTIAAVKEAGSKAMPPQASSLNRNATTSSSAAFGSERLSQVNEQKIEAPRPQPFPPMAVSLLESYRAASNALSSSSASESSRSSLAPKGQINCAPKPQRAPLFTAATSEEATAAAARALLSLHTPSPSFSLHAQGSPSPRNGEERKMDLQARSHAPMIAVGSSYRSALQPFQNMPLYSPGVSSSSSSGNKSSPSTNKTPVKSPVSLHQIIDDEYDSNEDPNGKSPEAPPPNGEEEKEAGSNGNQSARSPGITPSSGEEERNLSSEEESSSSKAPRVRPPATTPPGGIEESHLRKHTRYRSLLRNERRSGAGAQSSPENEPNAHPDQLSLSYQASPPGGPTFISRKLHASWSG